MIRYEDLDFDADEVISRYLTMPATVASTGVLGRFDTLRAALEHVQSHGVEGAVLAVHAPGQEELQFSYGALTALADRFYDWPSGASVKEATAP